MVLEILEQAEIITKTACVISHLLPFSSNNISMSESSLVSLVLIFFPSSVVDLSSRLNLSCFGSQNQKVLYCCLPVNLTFVSRSFCTPSNSARLRQVGKQNAAECMPLIMEPLSAFYNSPLVVLDFQSLYPSVMIAYNYCVRFLLFIVPYLNLISTAVFYVPGPYH